MCKSAERSSLPELRKVPFLALKSPTNALWDRFTESLLVTSLLHLRSLRNLILSHYFKHHHAITTPQFTSLPGVHSRTPYSCTYLAASQSHSGLSPSAWLTQLPPCWSSGSPAMPFSLSTSTRSLINSIGICPLLL